MLTIIDCVGFKKQHIAVFLDDERVELLSVENSPEARHKACFDVRSRFLRDGMRCMELKCSPRFREFVSVSDFPSSLKDYFA